ncbi:BCD family MFS transporter [Methylobacterium brachythecii]|uniref:BCD family chlorophyll transporter-like MFS transporter n=1 Tax=Methylobacterium brachythecii TaxID=1176177 RepID=A0A7W6F920_9HYPH|nr:BCD family MFS transporter [Methylobacterium brachythecii]MBB3905058.1 BCD family chlorophyll transporter-like MFS transporter [Methylobacterium brachythecii]GLS44434.1 bacteriochlorophyll synthase [Methylobacterium brachythecii]
MPPLSFTWWQICRLGLVQTALGAVVVIMTSTINRVMVVELALPAMVPGGLVALHYAVQILRPRWGYGSDRGRRRTPWIVGGMALLAIGGFGAAAATALCEASVAAGLTLAVLSFLAVGIGVGAAGTSLLVLLATGVDDRRRGAAATVVWVMMIVGFAVTAPLAGHFLDPFSGTRLMAVSGAVSAIAFVIAILAVTGVEPARLTATTGAPAADRKFFEVLARVWAEPISRHFTIFIFVSMLAYSAQELILEPYAGLIFEMTPGATTKLSGLQHGGVLTGMLLVAGITMGVGGPVFGSLKLWTAFGCLGSAVSLAMIAAGGSVGAAFPLREAVFALGLCNGIYAVAAIGSMMGLAGRGGEAERGTRMGVWGAAQGIAFGAGGFLGTMALDLARLFTSDPTTAYASVFAGEAVLFVGAAIIALRIEHAPSRERRGNPLTQAAAFQFESGLETR